MDLISDTKNTIYYSPASGYEIQLKHALGKLGLAPDYKFSLVNEAAQEGWRELGLNTEMMEAAGKLALEHRDPFDRILAAQAMAEGIPIISIDDKLDLFGIERLW